MSTVVLRLRRVLLASLVLLACAATAPRAGAAGTPCLSSRVGEILSAKMAAHAFDGALAPGWTLQEVEVARDHIDLGVRDEQHHRRSVALRPGGEVSGDGRGRSFAFVIDAGGAPLDAVGRQGLLDLAARVDAAVPEDEALRRCVAGPSGSAGPGWAERGGALPRWVALSIGAFEVLVVLAALVFVRGVRRAGAAGTGGRAARLVWLDLVVLVLAWLAIHWWGETSPMLWIDTMNDQRDVRHCLVQGVCTSLGEATSVGGVYHAVGWLDFLGLARLAGLGLDSLYVGLQVLSAIGVMLAGATARRAWGTSAGLFAAFACFYFTVGSANQQVIYNTTLLPFLGAVFLLVGAAAVNRPGPASIALTALVGALLASIHSACVVSVISVVWVALLAPRHRVKLAAVGAAVFVGTALAIGPAAWVISVDHALSASTSTTRAHPAAMEGMKAALATYGTLIALALAARLVTRPDRRRFVDVALAIALPMLAASFAAAATSTVPTYAKYLAHVAPSGSVLIAALAAAASARISSALAQISILPAGSTRVVPPLLYAVIALQSSRWLPDRERAARRNSLSFDDAAGIPPVLAARGWTYAQVYRSLRSPHAAEILASFEMLAPTFPLGPGLDDPTVVYVAKVETSAIPKPLPERWAVASQDRDLTVVLVFVRSFLSWSHFAACDPRAAGGRDACVESGLSLRDDEKPTCVFCVPGMPPFQRPVVHTLELRMAVHATAGEAHAIVMPPPRPWLCAGTIASAGPASISLDHRRATWVEPTGSNLPQQEVRLDWTIGSSECGMNEYLGLPPFFLEGDPQSVEQLERLGL